MTTTLDYFAAAHGLHRSFRMELRRIADELYEGHEGHTSGVVRRCLGQRLHDRSFECCTSIAADRYRLKASLMFRLG